VTNLIASYTPGLDRNDFSGYVGQQFIPTASVTITSLGIRMATGNTGTRTVYLLDHTETVIASAVITLGGSVGTFYYASITGTVITSGLIYKLTTQVVNAGDFWSDDGAVTLNGAGTNASIYSPTGNSGFVTFAAGQTYVGLDMTWSSSKAIAEAITSTSSLSLSLHKLGAIQEAISSTSLETSALTRSRPIIDSAVTWNSSDNGGLALSNGNLTLTGTPFLRAIRAKGPFTTGKLYLESLISARDANWLLGFGDATTSLTAGVGLSGNSVAYSASTGHITKSPIGSQIGQASIGSVGQTACVAFDFAARLLWVRVNAGNWNNSGTANPATGVGGLAPSIGTNPLFPMFSGLTSADSTTTNFGATAFTQTVPSGFTGYTPFVFVTSVSSLSLSLHKTGAISEAITSTSTETATLARSRPIAEAIASTSSFALTLNKTGAIQETISSTSSLSLSLHKLGAITEAISSVSTETATLTRSRPLIEAISSISLQTATLGRSNSKPLSEAIASTSSLSLSIHKIGAVRETIISTSLETATLTRSRALRSINTSVSLVACTLGLLTNLSEIIDESGSANDSTDCTLIKAITGLNYTNIINQVTTRTGSVFQYVAFAVTPQQINWLSANPVYPAAFISPGSKDTEPNQIQSAGDLRQWITESFSVCVLFENQGDLLGQQAIDQVTTIREALRRALVNWHPLALSRTSAPIIEGDDSLFIFEGGARTGWLFNYSQRYQIDTDDCFTPTPTPSTLIGVITTFKTQDFIMPSSPAGAATPGQGTSSQVLSAGAPVIAIQGPVIGGYISNPETAADQNISVVEALYVDPVNSPSVGVGNGTTTSLDPGQSWLLPCPIATGVIVRVVSASAGHKFTVVTWS
jgi:hypothetical protein